MDDKDAAERRRMLAEALISGRTVAVTNSGEVKIDDDGVIDYANQGIHITVPDTIGDTYIWAAHTGTFPPDRMDKVTLNYQEQEANILYAYAQTTQGPLVIKFIRGAESLCLSTPRIYEDEHKGVVMPHMCVEIEKTTPDIVFGIWGHRLVEIDTRIAKQRLLQVKQQEDAITDNQMSGSSFVPRCIYEDYYYAEDNLGNPYTVLFLNRCSNYTEYYKNKVGIPVPPEKPYPSITITIGDEYQTQSTLFQILKHSVLCLDISEVLHKFTNFNKQGDTTMDNMDNNVNNDAVAARRRALAEALRTGEPVIVTASGEVETKEDAMDMGMAGIQVPDGKLA